MFKLEPYPMPRRVFSLMGTAMPADVEDGMLPPSVNGIRQDATCAAQRVPRAVHPAERTGRTSWLCKTNPKNRPLARMLRDRKPPNRRSSSSAPLVEIERNRSSPCVQKQLCHLHMTVQRCPVQGGAAKPCEIFAAHSISMLCPSTHMTSHRNPQHRQLCRGQLTSTHPAEA